MKKIYLFFVSMLFTTLIFGQVDTINRSTDTLWCDIVEKVNDNFNILSDSVDSLRKDIPETDPIFSVSVASGIDETDILNWNAGGNPVLKNVTASDTTKWGSDTAKYAQAIAPQKRLVIGVGADTTVIDSVIKIYNGGSLVFNTTRKGYIEQTHTLANTIVGLNAGKSFTTGTQNNGIGVSALYNATSGSYNDAYGYEAAKSLTTGYKNTVMGYSVFLRNTTGYLNCAYGNNTLSHNTSGYYNVAYGPEALNATTTGYGNIGIGYYAGYYNTTLSNRIFINSIDRTNIAGDSTGSPIFIRENATVSNQAIYLNGNTYVRHSLELLNKPQTGTYNLVLKNGVIDTTRWASGTGNPVLQNVTVNDTIRWATNTYNPVLQSVTTGDTTRWAAENGNPVLTNVTTSDTARWALSTSYDTTYLYQVVDTVKDELNDTASYVVESISDYTPLLADSNKMGKNGYITPTYFNTHAATTDTTYRDKVIDSLKTRITVLEDSIVHYDNHIRWIYAQLTAMWDSIDATPPASDVTAPEIDSARTINDTMIYMFASEDLNDDSIPHVDSIYVTEGGVRFGVQTITIVHDTIKLEMDSTIAVGSTLLIDYNQATTHTFEDLASNEMLDFDNQSVTNNLVAPPTGAVYYDNFNDYTASADLNGQGGWDAILNSIIVSSTDTLFRGNTSAAISLYWKPDSLTDTDDQDLSCVWYAAGALSGDVGVAGRVNATSGGNAYIYIAAYKYSAFGKIVNGTVTTLATGTGTTISGTIARMTINGSEIRCYLNGNLDTSLTGGTGIFTDTSITGNRGVGIATYGAQAVYGDNWHAKDYE